LQSVTAGSPATISKASGSVLLDYWSVKDITASGGAKYYATNSTNVSGNTGITFGTTPSNATVDIVGQGIFSATRSFIGNTNKLTEYY
jgi:hypothetical protein